MAFSTPDLVLGFVFAILGFFVSPAFGYVDSAAKSGHRSLAHIKGLAHRLAPSRAIRRAQSTSSDEPTDQFFTYAIILVIVVVLYLNFRAPILIGISILSIAIAFWTTVSLGTMSRRRIVSGDRSSALAFLALFLSATAGFVNIWLLLDPPAGGEAFRSFVSEYNLGNGFTSIEGFTQVAFQVTGVGAYIAVAVASIGFCFAVISALNLYSGTWGQLLWRFTFGWTSRFWGRRSFWACALLTLFSFILCGGWLYNWIGTLQEITVPTPTLTP